MAVIFTLITNIPQNKITTECLRKISGFISELFDTSEQDVLISIKTGVQMVWGTKPGSFALGTLQSTTAINAEDTRKYAPSIFDFVEREFEIAKNRMYLGFINLNSDNVAFGSKLYSTIKWE